MPPPEKHSAVSFWRNKSSARACGSSSAPGSRSTLGFCPVTAKESQPLAGARQDATIGCGFLLLMRQGASNLTPWIKQPNFGANDLFERIGLQHNLSPQSVFMNSIIAAAPSLSSDQSSL